MDTVLMEQQRMDEPEKSADIDFKEASSLRILVPIVIIALVLVVRLYQTALETRNWPGFYYSTLHIIIVGAGTYLALKPTNA